MYLKFGLRFSTSHIPIVQKQSTQNQTWPLVQEAFSHMANSYIFHNNIQPWQKFSLLKNCQAVLLHKFS